MITVSPKPSPGKVTSQALKTPAKIVAEAKLDNNFTPPPTEPRRSKRSAAAVAKSNIKRSFEAAEEDATPVTKRARIDASVVLRKGKDGRDIGTLRTLELFEKKKKKRKKGEIKGGGAMILVYSWAML